MTEEPSAKEAKLFADFENAGEADVRCQLVAGEIQLLNQQMARNWLKRKQDARDQGRAAVEEEKIAIARLTKDAAWGAVAAARGANTLATIAIWLSGLSLIASVSIGIWFSHR